MKIIPAIVASIIAMATLTSYAGHKNTKAEANDVLWIAFAINIINPIRFMFHQTMKQAFLNFTGVLLCLVTIISCNMEKDKGLQSESAYSEEAIFPKGELGPATNFTGNAYNFGLVANDSTYNTLVGNVYFEKSARSNWHVHPGGQILIVLDGEGYHQLDGQPKQTMKKGDVIKCPPKVKHWHGATENSSLTQMYILPETENGIVTWLEPVTDEQYKSGN